MSLRVNSRLVFPEQLKVDQQIRLSRIQANESRSKDAASFFEVPSDEMQEALNDQSLIVYSVEKPLGKNVGYAAFEKFASAEELVDRMKDVRAAETILEQGLHYASSLYLHPEHCGQGIGSKIVQTLQQGDFPWLKQVFQMVDDTNKASTQLQKKFNMQVVTKIYVPSSWDFLCCKFGMKATAYRFGGGQ